MVSGFFRKKNPIAKVVLWVLVGMIAVGLLGTTVAWYLGPESERPKPDSASPQEEIVATEVENQEALRKQYEGMLASKPNDLNVLTGYARVELRLGILYLQEDDKAKGQEALQRSEKLYQKALEQQDDLQLRLELANVYQMMEKDGKVIAAEIENLEALREQYEDMLNSKPNDLNVMAEYARVETGLGELYLQEDDKAKGQEAFQRSVALYQKALEQQDDLQLRLELANVYQMMEKDDKAEGELNKILKEDPENIQALAQMGVLLESREDWEGAIKAWKKVSSSPQADEMTKELAKSRIEEIKKKK